MKKKIKRKSRKQRIIERYICIGVLFLIILIICTFVLTGIRYLLKPKIVKTQPEIDIELLTVNEYSRPGTMTDKINAIVVHYTANPKTTAMQNRNYFENLKDSGTTSASSHFIIGLEGEIVQCIPTKEIAYASNDRNIDSISIECCHEDETGEFNEATYNSLVYLSAWLCGKFDLKPDDIIRHYDITGKNCPKYYVENEDKWEEFKKDVKKYIDTYGER